MKAAALLLLLTACTALPPGESPQTPPPHGEDGNATAPGAIHGNTVPYPAPDLQKQIDELGLENARLQKQIDELQNRVRRLERPARKPAAAPRAASETAAAPPPAESPLDAARREYRNGRYAAAARLLAAAESGGSGSVDDRRAMHLLLQSHHKLGNCESVINIGRRYVSRFRNSPEAPDTLFAVGQCQWDMQQRDIARDTWRRLMRVYPGSAAAQKAAQHADKY